MNKITVLLGPSGSGKTYQARQMYAGKSFISTTEEHLPNAIKRANLNGIPEVLFVDGVHSLDSAKQLIGKLELFDIEHVILAVTTEEFKWMNQVEVIHTNYQPE